MDGADRQIVQVDVPPGQVELAADALWQADPSAVSEVELPNGLVRLTADVVAFEAIGPIGPIGPIEVLHVDEGAYLDAWRAFARPARAGRHLVVQPPWVEAQRPAPDDVVVLVDPARAFGSGSHPATRVALAALEDHVRAGDHVIDIGCGSGVLAIASVLLGAAGAVAVDLDPSAVDATVGNAARNGVAEAIDARLGSVEVVEHLGDVVVANIGLRVLLEIGPALVELVRPRGRLVLSGLLVEQVDDVVAPLTAGEEQGRYVDGEWVAVVLGRIS